MVRFRLDTERTLEALIYLASKSKHFDKYQACKLLFFADKYHLVHYGRPISGDEYAAMKDGPVPSAVFDFLKFLSGERLASKFPKSAALSFTADKNFVHHRLVPTRPPDLDCLSESDREALDLAIERFDGFPFEVLRSITHETEAYRKAWKAKGHKQSVPMKFEDFFEKDSDAMVGALEEMLENSAIREALSGR